MKSGEQLAVLTVFNGQMSSASRHAFGAGGMRRSETSSQATLA
jgi:hypothetical protein